MQSSLWLQNTLYVIVFILLFIEGINRLKDQVFHIARLAILPMVLLLIALESLYVDVGARAGHIALFISGLCIITFFAYQNMHLSILIVSPSNKRIVLAGSVLPLSLFLCTLGMKYSCNTLLGLSENLSQNSILLGIISLVYGGICGWFTGLFLLIHQQITQAVAIPLHRPGQ